MIELQVFILTRDRPRFLKKAVESLLINKPPEVELIISDNSVGSETENTLGNVRDYIYIRRSSRLAPIEHIDLVIEECSSPYVIIFHDDDMVGPQYLKSMLGVIKNDDRLVAAGCNAYVVNGEKVTSRKMMGFFSKPKRISNAAELLTPYFRFGSIEPPPFPGYIYRSSVVKGARFLTECGKHSDVSNLSRILSFGEILWVPECHIFYRYHGNNGGATFSVGDKLKLMRYAISRHIFVKHGREILEYRVRMHGQWLISILKGSSARQYRWRIGIITKFLVANIISVFFSIDLWMRVLSRRAW